MGLIVPRDKLCLLQLSTGDDNAYLVHFVDQDYSAPNLKQLLLDPSRQKIFHFARFDLAAISYYLNIQLSNIFCTKVASRLIRTYTDSHGLKELCRELLGIQLSKQQQSSYWGAADLTKEQQEYAARDVLYLHQIRSILTSMLIKAERLDMANQLFSFLPLRAELDLLGWNETDIFAY